MFRMEIVMLMLMPRLIPLRIQKDKKGILPPFRDFEIQSLPSPSPPLALTLPPLPRDLMFEINREADNAIIQNPIQVQDPG